MRSPRSPRTKSAAVAKIANRVAMYLPLALRRLAAGASTDCKRALLSDDVDGLRAALAEVPWPPVTHLAALLGARACCRWLVASGASTPCLDGWLPRDVATWMGDPAVIDALQEEASPHGGATQQLTAPAPLPTFVPPQVLVLPWELRLSLGAPPDVVSAPDRAAVTFVPGTLPDNGGSTVRVLVALSCPRTTGENFVVADEMQPSGAAGAWSTRSNPQMCRDDTDSAPRATGGDVTCCAFSGALDDFDVRITVDFNFAGACGPADTRSASPRRAFAVIAAAHFVRASASGAHAGALVLPLLSHGDSSGRGSGDIVGSVALTYCLVRRWHEGSAPVCTPAGALDATQEFWCRELPRRALASRVWGHRGTGAEGAAVVPRAPRTARTSGVGVTRDDPDAARRRLTHVQENSPLSLALAAAAGARFVECDVHITRDGVPVVHHDFSVKLRGTDIRVAIGDITAAQFLALAPQPAVGNDEFEVAAAAAAVAAAAPRRPLQMSSAPAPPPPAGDVVSSTRHTRADSSPPQCRAPVHGAEGSAASSPLPAPLPLAASAFARTVLRDRFCTLRDLLAHAPAGLGVNIEVKYPSTEETTALGLRPLDRNDFADRVLVVAVSAARSRPLCLSSFDADMCITLARKQAAVPVLFLTEGGGRAGTPPALDPRCRSLAAAVAFARAAGLIGIVTHVAPLLASPRAIAGVREAGLLLATYGAANNEPAAVAEQLEAGVAVVIVDHVRAIVRGVVHGGH